MASRRRATWETRDKCLSRGTATFSLSKFHPTTPACDSLNCPRLEEVCLAFNYIPALDPDQLDVDTLWASGYEIYDRLSEPMRKFLEQHTANYTAPCKPSITGIQDPDGS